ncbi:MAG: hypothetical protein BMS9Abin37_2708 [Acidobacteriota bacterium]|nr:MAG: hypothetical protein BMS9Abin37_2708 [Acidobacteriota bacterium]
MPFRQLGALLTSRTSEPARSESQWNELVASAVRERVAAVLAHVVLDDDDVPPNARRELARELYNTGACNVLLYRELARVLEANRTNNATTAPILLKGGALASTVYDDIALRPMSDLDLLIRRVELPAWKDCLVRLGYEPVSPEMAKGLAQAVHYQLAYRGGLDGDVVIELHWNLVAGDFDWRAPDVDWFWRQTEPWPGIEDLGCPAALQLTPLASVLYLSAHAMLQHGGARARLLWLYDIHLLFARSADAIDWQDVIDRARDFRWDAAVARALERCHELFGTVVPETLVDELSQGASPEAEGHVHGKAEMEASRAALVWREFLCLRTTGRLRLLMAILFPAPAYMKWRYPRAGAAWPLAYVYRWGVVAREGTAHAFRVLTTALSFVSL